MTTHSEENRIVDKIHNRKIFQTETWSRLNYIFKVLTNAGFQRICDFRLNNSMSIGWQYYLINDEKHVVRVLATEFLGQYIQVEFQKP